MGAVGSLPPPCSPLQGRPHRGEPVCWLGDLCTPHSGGHRSRPPTRPPCFPAAQDFRPFTSGLPGPSFLFPFCCLFAGPHRELR